jgi:hypothetical protein
MDWSEVMDVTTKKLLLSGKSYPIEFLAYHEIDSSKKHAPTHNAKTSNQLPEKNILATFSTIKDSNIFSKECICHDSPHSTDTMDLESFKRVIDL